MKKNMIKILVTLILFILLLCNINMVFAIDTSAFKDVVKVGEGEMGSFATFGGKILYIVQFVGYSVAVIMLAVMGIQYMMSSPNQKADLKSKFVPYAIGAVLLFGGSTLLNIIYRIITQN